MMHVLNESVVCTCSGAYMRAEIGNENLVVCLSENLPIYVIIGLKCRLTCCPRGKQCSNHEVNRYVYRP